MSLRKRAVVAPPGCDSTSPNDNLPPSSQSSVLEDDVIAGVNSQISSGTSQTERALLGLRELILEGHLRGGERLSELLLVERLSVSRTPVRAALGRLQDEGLIEPIASGGYAVRSFTANEIGDSIEMRGTLEGLAARLAAERGVDALQLQDLNCCVDEIDAILKVDLTDDTFSAYVSANRRLHALLARACKSSVIERQIDKVTSMPFASPSAFVMVQSIDASARDMLRIAQAQHRAVVDAIEHREGARAEALMREHARIAHRNLRAALDSQSVMQRIPGGNLINLPIRAKSA
jgi:GntR family transcriptional regulator of vanillate catabolism